MKRIWTLALLICLAFAGALLGEEVNEAQIESTEIVTEELPQETEIAPLATSDPPSGVCTFGQPSFQQCQDWSNFYCNGEPTHCACTQWSFGPGGFQCTGGGQCECT